jgi:hypothetical protein
MGCVYKNTTLSSEIVYFVSTKYDLKQAFDRRSRELFYLLM